MILEREFTVRAPAERVWSELLDADALAACLPGAQLQSVPGGHALQGALQPRIGSGAIDCFGSLRPVDVDEDARSATWRLEVRESGGAALVSGLLRGSVTGNGDGGRVVLTADARLAGVGPAQAAQSEGDRLMQDFATELEHNLSERAARPVQRPSEPAAEPVHGAPRSAAEPVSALGGAISSPSSDRPAVGPAGVGLAAAAALAGVLIAARGRRRRVRFEIRYRW